MTPKPGREGTLDSLVELLRSSGELLGGEGTLRVRTVAVRAANQWLSFGTLAETIAGRSTEAQNWRLRDSVVLCMSHLPLDESLNIDTLMSALAGWRSVVNAPSQLGFQTSVQLFRRFSDPDLKLLPRWEVEANEAGPTGTGMSVPDGPFLESSLGIFAASVPELAGGWFGNSTWADTNIATNRYRILIEDRRAWLDDLQLRDQMLTVRVQSRTKEPLFCALELTSYRNVKHRSVVQFGADAATMDAPFAAQACDIWVTFEDGYPLDHYHESPHRASWGRERSLYNAPPRRDPLLEDTHAALASGENVTLEFKPYVRLRKKDNKAREVLETACAFANASGGDILIGVTDFGEPIGVNAELRKEYGGQHRDDFPQMQDSYVRDLKKLFGEGLTTAVIAEFRWLPIALDVILRVRIPPSRVMVSLITTGEIFRRVNATNRKVRPDAVILPGR